MIKLKTILSEGYAWEREAGKPLPTLEQTTAAHAAKQAEQSAEQPLSNPIDEVQTFHGDPDDIFEEIAEYLVDDGHAPSLKAAMHALERKHLEAFHWGHSAPEQFRHIQEIEAK
jgi:hypothetical protein